MLKQVWDSTLPASFAAENQDGLAWRTQEVSTAVCRRVGAGDGRRDCEILVRHSHERQSANVLNSWTQDGAGSCLSDV